MIIKAMETEQEIRGKAYVHWASWKEAYVGWVSQSYLDKLSLEVCEKIADRFRANTLVAKDGDRVVGFVCYNRYRWEEELSNCGEISAIYVLSAYYGTEVAPRLMQAALDALATYPRVAVLVLKENQRAIKFYQKFGFQPDGIEFDDETLQAIEIRMVMDRNEVQDVNRKN